MRAVVLALLLVQCAPSTKCVDTPACICNPLGNVCWDHHR